MAVETVSACPSEQPGRALVCDGTFSCSYSDTCCGVTTTQLCACDADQAIFGGSDLCPPPPECEDTFICKTPPQPTDEDEQLAVIILLSTAGAVLVVCLCLYLCRNRLFLMNRDYSVRSSNRWVDSDSEDETARQKLEMRKHQFELQKSKDGVDAVVVYEGDALAGSDFDADAAAAVELGASARVPRGSSSAAGGSVAASPAASAAAPGVAIIPGPQGAEGGAEESKEALRGAAAVNEGAPQPGVAATGSMKDVLAADAAAAAAATATARAGEAATTDSPGSGGGDPDSPFSPPVVEVVFSKKATSKATVKAMAEMEATHEAPPPFIRPPPETQQALHREALRRTSSRNLGGAGHGAAGASASIDVAAKPEDDKVVMALAMSLGEDGALAEVEGGTAP